VLEWLSASCCCPHWWNQGNNSTRFGVCRMFLRTTWNGVTCRYKAWVWHHQHTEMRTILYSYTVMNVRVEGQKNKSLLLGILDRYLQMEGILAGHSGSHYNPSYSGGRDQENCILMPAPANSLETLSWNLENTQHKKGLNLGSDSPVQLKNKKLWRGSWIGISEQGTQLIVEGRSPGDGKQWEQSGGVRGGLSTTKH
jgi:hypothetical protein